MSYPNRYFLARLTIGSADEKTLFRGVYHGSLLIDPSGCGSNAVGYTEVPVYGTTAQPRPAGPAGEHCPQAVPKNEIRSFNFLSTAVGGCCTRHATPACTAT